MDFDLIDRFIEITDADSFAMARRCVREEGVLTGGSGGMAIEAALQVAVTDPHRLVVVIVPDSGRGYLSKTFNDDWMSKRGFDI